MYKAMTIMQKIPGTQYSKYKFFNVVPHFALKRKFIQFSCFSFVASLKRANLLNVSQNQVVKGVYRGTHVFENGNAYVTEEDPFKDLLKADKYGDYVSTQLGNSQASSTVLLKLLNTKLLHRVCGKKKQLGSNFIQTNGVACNIICCGHEMKGSDRHAGDFSMSKFKESVFCDPGKRNIISLGKLSDAEHQKKRKGQVSFADESSYFNAKQVIHLTSKDYDHMRKKRVIQSRKHTILQSLLKREDITIENNNNNRLT